MFGIFHEHGKVVNSLFGESRRIAEFGSTNCQLEYERSRDYWEVFDLPIPCLPINLVLANV